MVVTIKNKIIHFEITQEKNMVPSRHYVVRKSTWAGKLLKVLDNDDAILTVSEGEVSRHSFRHAGGVLLAIK